MGQGRAYNEMRVHTGKELVVVGGHEHTLFVPILTHDQ